VGTEGEHEEEEEEEEKEEEKKEAAISQLVANRDSAILSQLIHALF
jgi:hypothetical protein